MTLKSIDRNQEVKEMVRCVQLFFGQHKQQRDIAVALGIHQSKVSRLLKRAQEEGLYSIDFSFPVLLDIAGQMIDRYGLRDAVVVPTGLAVNLKEDLGRAAARYVERVAGAGAKVGLSCGNTLLYLVKHLKEDGPRDLAIYPLAAETTLKSVDISPNTLVGMMTAKYRPAATGYSLPAQLVSAMEPQDSARQAFLNDREIRKIIEESQDVDIALVGVGALDASCPGFCEMAAGHKISAKRLKRIGFAGEFNYQPFNGAGAPLEGPEISFLTNRFIGVPLQRLRELSRTHGRLVVGIGGGPEKRAAVEGVLAGHLINVLITDQDTAEGLLSE
jgi:DNA-binding transcriptional regulator LsrR (DeoR family)